MKNMSTIIVSVTLGTLILLLIMTLEGRANRSVELKSNFSSVIEETLEILTVNPKYRIDNTDEFVADFVQNLSEVVESDADISVQIMNIDKEKGVLSIRVIEEFQHPNGKNGTVKCDRTVILNRSEQEDENEPIHTVSFYLKKGDVGTDRAYKVYRIPDGKVLSVPAAPTSAEGMFAGWLDTNDYMADFSVPVTQDLIYYALWN